MADHEPRQPAQDTGLQRTATIEQGARQQSSQSGTSDMAFQYAQECASGSENPEEGRLALQMAVDVMNRGEWWRTQPMPSAYAEGLQMMSTVFGSRERVYGQLAVDTFESSVQCLRSAVSAADPAWVAAEFDPLVELRRRELYRGMATVAVDAVEAAKDGLPSTPEAQLMALEGQLDGIGDGFQSVEDFVTLSNIKLGRKAVSHVDWGAIGTKYSILDPETGQGVPVGSLAAVKTLIGRMKTVLRVASGGTAGIAESDSTTTAGQLADAATAVKTVVETTTGLAALFCDGASLAFRASAAALPATSEFGLEYAAQSARFAGYAGSIASAASITGALAAIDLVRHGCTLFDSEATADEQLDAGVGMAVAGANFGYAVAAGAEASGQLAGPALAASWAAQGICGAAAVAVPVTWWTFKSSMRLMAQTTIGGVANGMVPQFDLLVARANSRVDCFGEVTTALQMRDRELDPDMRRAFDAVANEKAAKVSRRLLEMREGNGIGTKGLRRELHRALAHPGANGACRDPTVVLEAVEHMTKHVAWCLENAEQLVIEEAGYGVGPLMPGKSVDKGLDDGLGECDEEG